MSPLTQRTSRFRRAAVRSGLKGTPGSWYSSGTRPTCLRACCSLSFVRLEVIQIYGPFHTPPGRPGTGMTGISRTSERTRQREVRRLCAATHLGQPVRISVVHAISAISMQSLISITLKTSSEGRSLDHVISLISRQVAESWDLSVRETHHHFVTGPHTLVIGRRTFTRERSPPFRDIFISFRSRQIPRDRRLGTQNMLRHFSADRRRLGVSTSRSRLLETVASGLQVSDAAYTCGSLSRICEPETKRGDTDPERTPLLVCVNGAGGR